MEKEGIMAEYYRREEARLRAMGFTDDQIEERLDRMVSLANLVLWTTR